MLANPPFGVEWKPEEDFIRKEHDEQDFGGRFGAGLPRINDGSFLFLQHMISKMKDPKDGGSRLSIVFNGSPLFTGSAGSGEKRNPPLDYRERLVGRYSHSAGSAFLQYGDFYLSLDFDESKREALQRENSACGRHQLFPENAQRSRQ